MRALLLLAGVFALSGCDDDGVRMDAAADLAVPDLTGPGDLLEAPDLSEIDGTPPPDLSPYLYDGAVCQWTYNIGEDAVCGPPFCNYSRGEACDGHNYYVGCTRIAACGTALGWSCTCTRDLVLERTVTATSCGIAAPSGCLFP